LTRRAGLVALLTGLFLSLTAGPALAHGIGGRLDPRVPRWLFLYGAAGAVIVSFVALASLWKEPRLQGTVEGRPVPRLLQRLLLDPILERAVRALFLAVFVIVTLAGIDGGPSGSNLAPVIVYIWFWVGLAFAHALFGNLWGTISPWDTMARLFQIGGRPVRRYPARLGRWPAALLLLGFVWMELVDPSGAEPRALATAILAYTAVTLIGMGVFGREAWTENGEAFAVYFGLLSRLAPFTRDARGRVVIRPFLGGLPSLEAGPGLVAFVVVSLGSTTFDGFTRSSTWLGWITGMSRSKLTLLGTTGLLCTVLLVAALYEVAMAVAAAVGGDSRRSMAARYIHSLVPIAFAYAVAHYFSFLLLEGQQGLILASDPFGRGWDLFGTASWHINYSLVSAFAVWYVQVAAIVGGHVAGVILAHDRAIAEFPPGRALRTQYALLGVMVMFTVGGLLILSRG
jgi:hypothetical protein